MLLAVLVLLFLLSRYSLAWPVQFCRSRAYQDPNEAVDFCISLSAEKNNTSNFHDIYLALSINRAHRHALGWTAVGIGSSMKGSLMFVVYGIPMQSAPPVVSIRTASGYMPPQLVPPFGSIDFEILESYWDLLGEGAVANIKLACYSCTSWTGSTISVSDSSQPWSWAWNKDQLFQDMSDKALLEAHSHGESGGTGAFHVDMVRAAKAAVEQDPPTPHVRPGVGSIGAFEGHIKASSHRKRFFSWSTHGLLMSVAFLLAFPVGSVSIRLSSPKCFQYHWAIQLLASVLVFAGVIVGLVLSHQLRAPHQFVGIGAAIGLGLQGLLGWRHHIIFMRTKRSSKVSIIHVYLGRVLMVLSWGNILSGLSLAGFSKDMLLGVALFVSIEATGMWFLMWSASRRQTNSASTGQLALEEETEEYSALQRTKATTELMVI